MTPTKPVKINVVSDVVCPWCYIGKRRLEKALALVPDIPTEIHWRPFLLQSDLPREGIDRKEYLEAKFGSVDAYMSRARAVVSAADEDGLSYRPELITRQPNTIDCHRIIHWAASDPSGDKSGQVKQRLMELFFRDGGDLTDPEVLVQAAADCGMDADSVRRRLATDEDVNVVLALVRGASAQGISGVPTYIFADKYGVSGALPVKDFAQAIREISAELNAAAAE